jgi:hypothetical protein
LKKRVNQRLKKLAKWSDSSSEERQSEFRVFRGSYGYTSSSSYRPAPPTATTPYRPPAYPSQAPQQTIGRPFPSASNSYNPNSTIGIISNNFNNSSALSSNPAPRTSSFPLLASALAERAQHLEQKQTQPPPQSTQPLQSQSLQETPSVRKQLEQELQEKDSQREELIAKLQSELQQHQQEQKDETPAQEQEETLDEIDPMEESVEEGASSMKQSLSE